MGALSMVTGLDAIFGVAPASQPAGAAAWTATRDVDAALRTLLTPLGGAAPSGCESRPAPPAPSPASAGPTFSTDVPPRLLEEAGWWDEVMKWWMRWLMLRMNCGQLPGQSASAETHLVAYAECYVSSGTPQLSASEVQEWLDALDEVEALLWDPGATACEEVLFQASQAVDGMRADLNAMQAAAATVRCDSSPIALATE